MPDVDLYLTREQLTVLTATKQPKRMCAWLTANGWVHLPPARRGDIPKVLRSYHDDRLSGRTPSAQQGQPRRARPNFDWMLNPSGSDGARKP